MHPSALTSPVALAGTESPTLNADSQPAHAFERTSRERVSAQSHMTDSGLEQAIQRAGRGMESAYGDYAKSGSAEDLERAYRHLQQMRELSAKRSPEFVRTLEQQRGLR